MISDFAIKKYFTEKILHGKHLVLIVIDLSPSEVLNQTGHLYGSLQNISIFAIQ